MTHRQRQGPVETVLPCLTCSEKEVRKGALSGSAVSGAQGCWLQMAGRPGGVYTGRREPVPASSYQAATLFSTNWSPVLKAVKF